MSPNTFLVDLLKKQHYDKFIYVRIRFYTDDF